MNDQSKRKTFADPGSGDLSQFLTYRIARLHLALNAHATALLAREGEIGLGQWRLLSMVGSGSAATTRELADKTKMDPAFISRTLRSLEALGLAEATRSPADRRQVDLTLTRRGTALYEKVLPRMQARQRRLMATLNKTERTMIFGIIDKLERAVTQDGVEG